MKSVAHTRDPGDLRTSIGGHAPSVPRQGGATHHEVYLLDKERHRLEIEQVMLDRRQKRVMGRLEEIRETVENLVGKGQQEESAPASRGVYEGPYRR